MKIPPNVLAGRTETECMNALHNFGIVSANCVWWWDIGNQTEAIAWLTAHPEER